jgi:uncharacterized protein YkwD
MAPARSIPPSQTMLFYFTPCIPMSSQRLNRVKSLSILPLLGVTIGLSALSPAIDSQPSQAQSLQPTSAQANSSQLKQWRWKRPKPKPTATATPKPTVTPTTQPTPVNPAPTNPPVNPANLSPLAQEMLASHNQVRAQVGVGPVTWSPSLAAYAQQWADRLAVSNLFEHRTENRYGENLYWGQGRAASPRDVVSSWASEVKNYNYNANSCRGVCGHYTQLVWKKTTEIGCAVAKVRDQEYWVCNYNPPGNYIGQKPY